LGSQALDQGGYAVNRNATMTLLFMACAVPSGHVGCQF